MKRTR